MSQKKRIQWNSVYAIVEAKGVEGIALKDLADHFGVDSDDLSLLHALNVLKRRDKIIQAIGSAKDGNIGAVIQKKPKERNERQKIG